jgi:hypothetical protein
MRDTTKRQRWGFQAELIIASVRLSNAGVVIPAHRRQHLSVAHFTE